MDALAEADAAVRRLDRQRGRATRRAELLVTAARAALAAGEPGTAHERASAAARAFAAQRRDWWSVHSRLLVLWSRLGTGIRSPQLVRDAEDIARRLSALGSDEAVSARLLAGRAALAVGRIEVAEYQLSLAARARHRGPALARASGWLAEALRAQAAGRTRRTLDACRRGLQVLHQYRLTLGATELRARASAHGVELVAVALRACLRTGGARQLLVWGEHWRATAIAVPPVRPPEDRTLHVELARYAASVTGRPTKLPPKGASGRRAAPGPDSAEREIRGLCIGRGRRGQRVDLA